MSYDDYEGGHGRLLHFANETVGVPFNNVNHEAPKNCARGGSSAIPFRTLRRL